MKKRQLLLLLGALLTTSGPLMLMSSIGIGNVDTVISKTEIQITKHRRADWAILVFFGLIETGIGVWVLKNQIESPKKLKGKQPLQPNPPFVLPDGQAWGETMAMPQDSSSEFVYSTQDSMAEEQFMVVDDDEPIPGFNAPSSLSRNEFDPMFEVPEIAKGEDWVTRLTTYDPENKGKVFSFKIEGVSGSGKTVLAEYLLRKLASTLNSQKVQVFLCDPKFSKLTQNWSFIPQATTMESIPLVVSTVYETMVGRSQGKLPVDSTIFLIIDEIDWVLETVGKDIIGNLKSILKVGRSSQVFLIVVGQSYLCPKAGNISFDTTTLAQFNRICIGDLAFALLNAPAHFPYMNRDALRDTAAIKKQDKKRFALVISPNGFNPPSIEEIPDLSQVPKLTIPVSSKQSSSDTSELKAFFEKCLEKSKEISQEGLDAIVMFLKRKEIPQTARDIQRVDLAACKSWDAGMFKTALDQLEKQGLIVCIEVGKRICWTIPDTSPDA